MSDGENCDKRETYEATCWRCGGTVEVNLYRRGEGEGGWFAPLSDGCGYLCETIIGGYVVETRNKDSLPHEGPVKHSETVCWEWDCVGRGKRLLVLLAPPNSLFQHDLVVSRIRQFGNPFEPTEDMELR